MNGYNWYKKNEKKYKKSNEEIVRKIKGGDIPQHILWAKSVADELVSGPDGYLNNEAGFFFTEVLVNKLMWFAYEKGASDIDKKSFALGWDECLAETLKNISEISKP